MQIDYCGLECHLHKFCLSYTCSFYVIACCIHHTLPELCASLDFLRDTLVSFHVGKGLRL